MESHNSNNHHPKKIRDNKQHNNSNVSNNNNNNNNSNNGIKKNKRIIEWVPKVKSDTNETPTSIPTSTTLPTHAPTSTSSATPVQPHTSTSIKPVKSTPSTPAKSTPSTPAKSTTKSLEKELLKLKLKDASGPSSSSPDSIAVENLLDPPLVNSHSKASTNVPKKGNPKLKESSASTTSNTPIKKDKQGGKNQHQAQDSKQVKKVNKRDDSKSVSKVEKKKEKKEKKKDKKDKKDKIGTSDENKKAYRERRRERREKERNDKKEKLNQASSNSNQSADGGNRSADKKRTRFFYNPYVTKEQLDKGLADGRYFFGSLRVNPKKYYDSYISVEGLSHDVYCGGLKDRNRAFNSDLVVFEILEEKEWKKRPNKEEEDDITANAVLKDTTVDPSGDEGTVVLLENEDLAKKLEDEKNLLKECLTTATINPAVIDTATTDESNHTEEDHSGSEDESDKEDQSGSDNSDEEDSDESESESDSTDEGFVKIKVGSEENQQIVQQSTETKSTAATITTTTTTTTTTSKFNTTAIASKSLEHTLNDMNQNIDKLEGLVIKAFISKLYVSVRVVYVLEAKHSRNHVGILVDDNPNSIFTSFVPMDTSLPKCCIFKDSIPQYKSEAEKYKKSLVMIHYSSWKDTSLLPCGHFKSLFGECGKIEPETHALLSEFGVETDPFSRAVMDCLPKVPNSSKWLPSKQDLVGRRDLREYEICTIDPDTAKDLDDALHCIELPDGNFEVGVHIADVSHFVKSGTELDKCAQRKATTVYLVQKAIPMLPSLLSEELCSLNMGVERLAFSVIWKLSKTGEILDEWFGRSVIKSFCRLTYGIAQALIDDKITNSWEDFVPKDKVKKELGPNTPEHIARVKKSVMGLRGIAKNLRNSRIENGAFTIHPSKLAFELDDKGNPISTKIYPIYESNNLVEEYMLLANMRVAERIAKFFPSNALLRKHPSPNENKLESFISFCDKHGFDIDPSSSLTFGESIKKLKETVGDINILMAIQLLSIRSMKLAEYFCTSTEEEENWRHYALNAPYYTHFTSPIRRYADIIVHRLLDLSIKIENASSDKHKEEILGTLFSQLPSSELVQTIAKNCNEKKLNARKAQERSDKVFLCVLLENHPTISSAVALNTGSSYITCIVPQFGSEQKIYLDDLKERGDIIDHSYDASTGENIIQWPSIDDSTPAVTQRINQLTTMKVLIVVNKDKFPIDTKCFLVHPSKSVS